MDTQLDAPKRPAGERFRAIIPACLPGNIHSYGAKLRQKTKLAFMRVRYSSSYIDRLYQERDIFALESVVEVVGGDQRLPEEFWLSMRLLAWCGWSRSGIWQYYEQISPEGFEAVAAALGKFGLAELEARYRAGMENWKKGGGCRELDEWIVMNQSNIEATSFELISCLREHLYATE